MQNSVANSITLQQYLKRDEEKLLDNYFLNLEKATGAKMVADFRFITKYRHIFWDDGNAPFFGITNEQLNWLSNEIIYYNKWHYVAIRMQPGLTHLLVRRVPVVLEASGEVLGQLFTAIVLNNNVTLLEQLKIASDINDVVLAVENEPIASTMEISDSLRQNLNTQFDTILSFGKEYLYNKTNLNVAGARTPITVYTMQSNTNILSLENNYQVSLLFSVISILLAAMLAKFLIQRRVANELVSLMNYAQGVNDDKKTISYEGSTIKEFDHIGHTLETTFNDLRDKERSFQDLFDFSLSPIIVWDANGEVIRMNLASERVFEKDGVFSGSAFLQFQSMIRPHLTMVNNGATITGMNIPVFEIVYRWNLSPIELKDGVNSIIAQGQDITTLVEAERQSNLARIEAEKSANARADFMAKMSHEIRTPLNGILGISQLLKKSITDPVQIESVDVLCQSGEHLLTVLNDILDFSRLEQGKFNVLSSDFLFSSLVTSIENIYRPLCNEKEIEFELINLVGTDIHFRTDKVRLNQILFNLLSNAVKFTHTGKISVKFELTDSKDTDRLVNVGSAQGGVVTENKNRSAEVKTLHISVVDTGIGISSAKLDSIFDPFVQSEKTTTREYGGSGLGLTIVKHLVELLGGTINVKSLVGRGSQFMINLPVQLVESHNIQSEEIKTKKPHQLFDRKLSLLLVEDNKTNAFIAKAFCEKYDMVVDWAEDGLIALDKLREKQYDLIFMDNQMPDLDGIEATKIIRNDLQITTPIFACTADGFEATRHAFLEAGADYVIVKPIKEQALYESFRFLKKNYLDLEQTTNKPPE